MTTSRPSQMPGVSLLVGSVLLLCAVLTVGVLTQTKREVGVTALKHQFRIAGHDRAEIHVKIGGHQRRGRGIRDGLAHLTECRPTPRWQRAPIYVTMVS